MDKLKLIALLASVGVTLANDATEEQIETALTSTFGKVKAADEITVTLANAQQAAADAKAKADADLKVAVDTVTTLTAALSNEKVEGQKAGTARDEATAKLATAQEALRVAEEKVKVADTTLANAREERAKTANEAAKLATDLTEAKTKLSLTVTSLTNERAEKAKVLTSLTNAKAAIVDLAVEFGKITPANRPTLEAALSNEVEFGGICDQLKKAQPVFKMAAILTNVGKDNSAGNAEVQYRALVNETMDKDKISYDKATQKVKASEKGKALLALMHQPEAGIPVVRS
jgi:colicin import membrane protein